MADSLQVLSLGNRAQLAGDLLAWFAEVKRDLPWRRSADLYGIWVSEIMLQQTTVQTVIPYWEQFMVRFPTVVSLAAAAESEVLKMWSGLGYYSRAHNLFEAARIICTERGGRLPSTRDDWMSLPGVGPYAGGAIASIGLGEQVPALDANARRVLLRWAVAEPSEVAALPAARQRRLVDGLGAELVPVENPGAWNEALMELGALVCSARRPDCGACPVYSHCNAWAGEWVSQVPPVKRSVAAAAVWTGQLMVTWRDRVLLVPPATPAIPAMPGDRPVARSDFLGLHPGLWGLPMTPWLAGRIDSPRSEDSWRGWLELPASLFARDHGFRLAGHFRHTITKYRLRVAVFHLELDPRQEMPAHRLGAGIDPVTDSTVAPGLFFRTKSAHPPLSALTEKGLHFHQDSVV